MLEETSGPYLWNDPSDNGTMKVTGAKGRTYRFSLTDANVNSENIEVRDFLNGVPRGLIQTNDNALANAPENGPVYVVNDETYKESGPSPDFLRLEFKDGVLVKVTTADLYEPGSVDSDVVESAARKQGQAADLIIRHKGGVSDPEAEQIFGATKNVNFERRIAIAVEGAAMHAPCGWWSTRQRRFGSTQVRGADGAGGARGATALGIVGFLADLYFAGSMARAR